MTESTSPPIDPADFVVVGGGPTGHAAAVAYRTAGGTGRVVLISADDAVPYERPPLSKEFLRGESSEAELPLESAGFYPDQGIEIVLSDAVVGLDPAGRKVTLASGRVLGYRECLLATGCRPAALSVPGADHVRVRVLRSLTEAQALRASAETAASAIVIGSGFIGCEAAVSLALRGIATTMIATTDLPQARRLGDAAGHRILEWLTAAGVELVGGSAVSEIRDGHTVVTENGVERTADLIVSATGVTPNSELADAAGLPTEDGRITVDAGMSTGVAGVRAAGDVCLAVNSVAGRRLLVEHWGEALRMGEVAGTNAAGGDETWSEVPGFWSQIGDHQLKYTAWGDGFDRDELVEHDGGGFTVWYSRDGRLVGALTHQADDDYDRAAELITAGATSWS